MNAPDVVRWELAGPSWRGDSVVIGTATDPYQQAESRYRITQRVLEAFRDFRNPVSITTKSPMVLRDLDLLSALARHVEVSVHFTVTTMDETLWRKIEPTTAKPLKRLEAMQRLRDHGIHTVVFLSPILPGLNDAEDQLEAVMAAARTHGADFIFSQPLRLGPGFAEYYLRFLRSEFPELADRYERLYRRDTPTSEYSERLRERVRQLKRKYGLTQGSVPEKEPAAVSRPAQLSLL